MSFLGDSGSEVERPAKARSGKVIGLGSRKDDDDKLRVNEKFAKK